MENLFSTVMYALFGRRWIRFSMIHGIKTALFIKRMEIEMNKERYLKIESELKALTDRKEFANDEDIKSNKKEIEIKKNHLEQVKGQMGQMYDQLNSDKRKLDFVKRYKF